MALVKAEDVTGPWQGLNNLSLFRQIGLLAGLAASIAVGAVVWSWAQSPGYRVLYSGLEERDVGQVIDALQQQGIKYRIADGNGTVMVPGNDIYSARLKLASQGLPQSKGGFEALPDQGVFGASQFMENARYQHSLEVELARTIGNLATVKAARVHLAIPKQSVFVRQKEKPSASVALSLYAGRSLEESQVAAITHLVASSVPNMEVGQVTVVDQRGQLLTTNNSSRELALTRTQFEYTQKVEQSYTARIQGLLEPVLGPNAVRAQVTADMDFTSTEQTQELFNPESAAVRSAQRVEEQSSGAINGGVPGALSNQPPGGGQAPEVAGNGAAESGSAGSNLRRREINNYELDRTINHTRFAVGKLRRLSIAVVLDDRVTVDTSGAVTRVVRTPEEINRISDLVKEAVGFDVQRGDRISIINAAFTLPAEPEPLPEAGMLEDPAVLDLAKQVLGVALVGLLLLGVLRPVMKALAKQAAVSRTAMPMAMAGDGLRDDALMLTGAQGGVAQIGGPRPVSTYESNMQMAASTVTQDPKLAAQVVKSWVASDEQ